MLKQIPYLEWMKEKIPTIKHDLGRTKLNHSNFQVNDLVKDINDDKRELSDFLANEYDVSGENFLITTGATFSNFLAYLYFKKKSKKFIIENPAYQPLFITPRSLNVKIERIKRRKDKDYSIDYEKLKEKLPKSSFVVITNRHNPSGRLFDFDELKKLSEIVSDNDSYLLVDEVYSPFIINQKFKESAFGGPTAIKLQNTVISNSLTKFFGADFIKIGWLGGDKGIIKEFKQYMNHFFVVSKLDKKLAKVILKNKKNLVKKANSLIQKNQELLSDFLDQRSELNGKIFDKNTYGFIEHKEINSEQLFNKCQRKGIFIVPGSFYGNKEYLRFSVSERNLKAKESLKRFNELLDEI